MNKLVHSVYMLDGVPYAGKLVPEKELPSVSCVLCRSNILYPGEFGRVYFCECGNEIYVNPKHLSINQAIAKRLNRC